MNENYFPSNLRFLRVKRDDSQATIAKVMGKRSTAISSWEQGNSQPSLDDLVELANYFEVYVGDLIGKDLKEGEVFINGRYLKKGEVLGEISGEVLANINKFQSTKKQLVKEAQKKDMIEKRRFDPATEKLEEQISKLWEKMQEVEEKLLKKLNEGKTP